MAGSMPLVHFKSTCPYDDKYLTCDRVTELYYGSSYFTDSILSRFRFCNIRNLSLSLPFNDQFLTAVSKLDRVTSLSIYIDKNENLDLIQSQLQLLLDQTPRLYSLSFLPWLSSSSHILPMEITSVSVRQLNIRGYDSNHKWYYFDEEQCIQLSRSSLGMKCETLLITVENRRNIIDFVNNMPNLQALNVRCEDDIRTDENDFVSFKNNELVEWLHQQLPSTCMITRDRGFVHDIRIWIR